MNKFIKVTHKGTGDTLYYRIDSIDGIGLDKDGIRLMIPGGNIIVKESFSDIESMMEPPCVNKYPNPGDTSA